MIDFDDLLDRIRWIMNSYGLTNSQFCEKIGVQRSLLSHVFSKRNRPSLDFLLKIHHAFDFITLDWLLLGEGDVNLPNDLFNEQSVVSDTAPNDREYISLQKAEDNRKQNQKSQNKEQDLTSTDNPKPGDCFSADLAHEIVVFYSDGTFKIFQNRTK